MKGGESSERLSDYFWDDGEDACKGDTKDDFMTILTTLSGKEGSAEKEAPASDSHASWTDKGALFGESGDNASWCEEELHTPEVVESNAAQEEEVAHEEVAAEVEMPVGEPVQSVKSASDSKIEDLPNSFWGDESDDFTSEISRLTLSSAPVQDVRPQPLAPAKPKPAEATQPARVPEKAPRDVCTQNVVKPPESKPAKVCIVPAVQRVSVVNECGFNFREYPRIVFLAARILVAHPTKQHRLDPRTKTERESISTLFTLFLISYTLPSLLSLDCEGLFDAAPMLRVLFSGDVKVDSIVEVVAPARISFLASSIPESSANAGEIMEVFFLNKGVAIRQAMKTNSWAMALFLAAGTEYKDEVHKAFLEYFDPMLRSFFGYCEPQGDWRQIFALLLRSPSEPVVDKLVKQLGGVDQLFFALSFYFVHSRPIPARMFFNNFYFLQVALRYGIEADGLDQLIGRYLKVMQEEGNVDVTRVYNKYKGRKGVQLGEARKGWLEGIKSVVDRSIFKIVGVEATSDPHAENIGERGASSSLNTVEAPLVAEPRGALESTDQSVRSGKESIYSYKGRAAANYWDRADQFYGAGTTLRPAEETVDAEAEKPVRDNEFGPVQDQGQLEDQPAETTNAVYGSREYSQSYVDLYTQEEPRSSLLPDILQDDAPVDEKRSAETRPGFFSKFSIFSKKKTYKVELNASTDFKYDPVTKKWGGSAPADEQTAPRPAAKEIPKPAPGMQKVEATANGSIKSRYTGRIPTEKQGVSLVDLLPKKK